MNASNIFVNFNNETVPAHGTLVRQQAEKYGNRVLAIIDDESITYSELYSRATTLARGMTKLGIKQGDRIGIFMPNCIDFAVAYFAGHLLDAIVVPVNARYKSHELAHALSFSDIRILLTTDRIDEHVNFCNLLFETLPDLKDCQAGTPLKLEFSPHLKHIVVFGKKPRAPLMSVNELNNLGQTTTKQVETTINSENNVDDIAVMLFTSGTTAAPKACQITHRAIYQSWVSTYPEAVSLKAGEKIWVPMPCFHIGGIGLLVGAMAHGACFISSIFHDPSKALQIIIDHQPEHLYPGFFTLLLPILREANYKKHYLNNTRTIVAVAPLETHKLMKQLVPENIDTYQLFGMTEAAGFGTFTPSTMPELLRLTTNGTAINGCTVRIANESDNTVLPNGAEGEIQFRGPNAFHSYYKDEAATQATKVNGDWVKTGDFGKIDDDGRLFFLGRIKDMLKVGGENVAAAEIEAYLGLHPAVKIAQVVGRADEHYGEVPVAFIELMDGQEAEAQEIVDFCKGKLASFRIPREVIFVKEWPMSSTKIQKFRLRKMLAESN